MVPVALQEASAVSFTRIGPFALQGAAIHTVELLVTVDTTSLSYWLNWRVLLCAIWVFVPMVIAAYMIYKHEGSRRPMSGKGERQRDNDWILYNEETWKPCLEEIHPFCLLAFRVTAFILLLATLVVKIMMNGTRVYFYYTQWTFTLVTIYFGFASVLSIHGCYLHQKLSSRVLNIHSSELDTEQGPSMPLLYQEITTISAVNSALEPDLAKHSNQVAIIWIHVFQFIFEMVAGAVMLTDSVYWCIIFPFLTIEDYTVNFMTIDMHTINFVLLLMDVALNRMRLPWYGISFFILWTGTYVIFQWIVHAFRSIWWPYPYLDLSSPIAPLWYLLMALMHIPCYGIFVVLLKVKYHLLSKWYSS